MPGDRAGGTNTLHAMAMAGLVVAAALIVGYVVFDLQVSVLPGDTQPDASFSFSHDRGANQLVVTHRGGDTLDPDRVVVLNEGFERVGSWPANDSITAGDSTTAAPVGPSETVYVMWVTEDDGYVTLATWNPNEPATNNGTNASETTHASTPTNASDSTTATSSSAALDDH